MKTIAAAFVRAQRERHTPEGRMTEAALFKRLLGKRKQVNQHSASSDSVTRLLSHVAFGASDCWYWIGSIDALGYGRFSHLEESRAHRVSYRIFHGDIASSMKVMHKCDTRCCVNPAHLITGTQAQNVADMVSKRRQKPTSLTGESNPMAKLTIAKVAEMRALVGAGARQRDMCSMFGVSPMTVSRVIRRELWK
jgi:hypothetical protein